MSILCCLFLELGLTAYAPHENPFPIDRDVVNPYATVAAGYAKTVGQFELSLSVSHTSSTATRYDRGDNGLSARVRYFAFR